MEHKGIHHIDGTYKITTHGYILVVYGISDQCGQFHPVSLMLTSHEGQGDFCHFYEGLIKLCNQFEIEFDPDYLMQDACPASRLAVLKYFPNVKILMCYFHVKKNVRIYFYKKTIFI